MNSWGFTHLHSTLLSEPHHRVLVRVGMVSLGWVVPAAAYQMQMGA